MAIHVIPGEISVFTIAVAVISGFILFFGYISMFLKEKLFLSEALVAVIVGIIAGPLVSHGFDPMSWPEHDEITKQLTRCIIAIQVMAVGIELPKHYLKKEWLTMLCLLLPTMVFMWLVSGLFIWALIPPINYLEALVISACVCPTDPILANSVVKGRFAEKHVPAHIRNALSAESGANDGMGFPFLFLAIFLIAEDNVGTAIGKWIYITWLFQIVLSCVIGVIVGFVARKVLQWSERNHLIDKPSFLAFAIALALFLMSMTGFSGSDDLLACFVAGNAFSWDDWFRQETEEAHFQEVIDMMLNLSIFVYIGAIIPWSEFGNQEIGLTPWRLVVIGILILLFRRLPIVILLKPVMPALKTYREAVFSGWFGPMGVGAVFLSIIAKEELSAAYEGKEEPVSVRLIAPVVLFIVFCSVIVHGTTIPLFKLGKRIRTRTLSITSISSNQVVRLPKLSSRKSVDEKSTMTELERNTLYNTNQYVEPSLLLGPANVFTSTSPATTGHLKEKHSQIAIDMPLQGQPYHLHPTHYPHPHPPPPSQQQHEKEEEHASDSDLAEEDFLPDDSSDTVDVPLQHPSPSHPFAPTTHTLHVPLSDADDLRRGSMHSEQAIRFVEPVKPRLTVQQQQQQQQQLNAERNEASVSSFRSWLSRQQKEPQGDPCVEADDEIKHTTTVAEEARQAPGVATSATTSSSHLLPHQGFMSIFKRNAKKRNRAESEQEAIPTTLVTADDDDNDADDGNDTCSSHHSSTVIMTLPPLTSSSATTHAETHREHQQHRHQHKGIHPRIEVWDEGNHVVVSDKLNDVPEIIVDKKLHASNWKKKVQEKMKQIEKNISTKQTLHDHDHDQQQT
ncbi:Sodium/hydrogen exchanger family-domain-containing protein [Mycotypha africana]|uniref:Sodium/hydrogen exchanger family-domain-containing protein n=1 Tax=Mycotypha africana TaxID=64632 RepID=UPI00230093CE|nr:Sodium/hydrogen exchanger family-domain-containing protein [Mycotypha africana]KAI8984694.1 Sodium/hydrogen exchanger family-domain-containing protein [Mycotypha africana]